VDLDAFFASVEQMDHPEYAGKPVIVGALPGGRGVVSTCSYEARSFGVRSAMPISEAYRRCPEAIFLPVRMYRYAELSEQVMEIFASFTPDCRPVSIDEAFLEMTGTEKLWGPPAEAAKALKDKVRASTGLSISIGVAANPYVAKIASGLRKPDGLVMVPEGGEADFMASIPLGKLWGAGEKTQERFAELGIRTVAQLAAMSEVALASLFGRAGGSFLYNASRGRDSGIMGGPAESRSMSSERTLERDSSDRELIETLLMELSEQISYRLWKEGLRSRCLVLKFRLSDFSTFSRRCSKPSWIRGTDETYAEALRLLDSVWDGRSEIRLLGLGYGDLEEGTAPVQGELFDDGGERLRKAEKAVFEIERRGIGELTRARCLDGQPRRGSPKRGADPGKGRADPDGREG
jgi:DNA polymerase-4